MTITYVWSFPVLDVKLSEDGMTNVVYNVNWIYSADDGAGHSATTYGSVGVEPPAPDAFTPYDELTKDQVQSWVVAALGVDQVAAMEVGLANQIQLQINPVDAPLPPPWSN